MIEKLLSRMAEAGTLRAIYQALASLFALATIGTWIGLAEPALEHSDVSDGRLIALGRTPLAVTYRALGVLGIPRDWVGTTGFDLRDLGVGALLDAYPLDAVEGSFFHPCWVVW